MTDLKSYLDELEKEAEGKFRFAKSLYDKSASSFYEGKIRAIQDMRSFFFSSQ